MQNYLKAIYHKTVAFLKYRNSAFFVRRGRDFCNGSLRPMSKWPKTRAGPTTY